MFKTKYRIVLKENKFYLQKKEGLFSPWKYILVQVGIDNFRPIMSDNWDQAFTRMQKYIENIQNIESKNITSYVILK